MNNSILIKLFYKQFQSPLFRINWKRIILDEAHNIRNHKTKTSIAVCNMTCVNHWALTGTPIHNKEADFFTLLKFIGCKPFDNWPVSIIVCFLLNVKDIYSIIIFIFVD